jgi:hypothetical protein
VYHCARNYLTFAANSIPVGGGDAKDSEPAILYSRLSGLIVCSCSAVEKAECQKVEIKRELQSFLMQAEAVINKSPQELVCFLSTCFHRFNFKVKCRLQLTETGEIIFQSCGCSLALFTWKDKFS